MRQFAAGLAVVALVAVAASRQAGPGVKETQLLREMTAVYTAGVEEYAAAYDAFWGGLKKGPDQDDLFLHGTNYLAMSHLMSQGANVSYWTIEEVRAQFRKMTAGLDDKGLCVFVKSEPNLAKFESRLRARLAMAAAAANDFLKRRGGDLKAAGIDASALAARVEPALKLCAERAEIFQALKLSKVVRVEGVQGWKNTEIKVREGEHVYVSSYGYPMSPDGIEDGGNRIDADAKFGMLLARIEGMEMGFPRLGVRGSFEADRSGLLMLRPNADPATDARCAFVAHVVIEKRKKKEDD